MPAFRSSLNSSQQRAAESQGAQSPLAIEVNMALTEVPIDIAQTMIDTDISPAIRAYSIAVAPEVSARSAIRAEPIRFLVTPNSGRLLRLLANQTPARLR